jgi:hypothetical protein
MEKPIDKRGKFDDEIFTYRITKDRKVFISWNGKHVTTLSSNKAETFIEAIEGADGKEAQLIMKHLQELLKKLIK